MATLKEPRYLEVTELRESSQSQMIAGMSDARASILIYDSEMLIDGYVGYSFEDETPRDIKIATLYTAERLVKQGGTVESVFDSMRISSEKTGPSQVSLNDLGSNIAANGGLPPYVINILNKYTGNSYISKQIL